MAKGLDKQKNVKKKGKSLKEKRAAKKEKKLLTSNSLFETSFAEMNIMIAMIIPVKDSIIGDDLTKTILIFLLYSFSIFFLFIPIKSIK